MHKIPSLTSSKTEPARPLSNRLRMCRVAGYTATITTEESDLLIRLAEEYEARDDAVLTMLAGYVRRRDKSDEAFLNAARWVVALLLAITAHEYLSGPASALAIWLRSL